MFEMNENQVLLCSLLSTIDMVDKHVLKMLPAAQYRQTVRAAAELVRIEFGHHTMDSFVGECPTLELVAENFHFASYGRFPDLKNDGLALRAQQTSDSLLARLGVAPSRTPSKAPWPASTWSSPTRIFASVTALRRG
jgi:hypothetical protein